MTMKALNKLLGRSTIDPAVVTAFEEGRIDEVIAEFDFSPEIRAQLCDLEAVDFHEFTKLAYQVVEKLTGDEWQLLIPNPMEGLRQELCETKEEQVA
jgi:hypothetical protein